MKITIVAPIGPVGVEIGDYARYSFVTSLTAFTYAVRIGVLLNPLTYKGGGG